MKKDKFDVYKYVLKYGKPDMERLGLFVEMPYMPVRLKPTPKDLAAEREKKALAAAQPHANMMYGFPKTKCGNQDGYFEEEFLRLFKGEGPGKSVKRIGPGKVVRKKDDQLPFIPAGPSKKHSGPGDYYGNFHDFTEFSPKTRKKEKFVHEQRSPITNPPKQGGPGYIDITISPYPEYIGGQPRREKKEIKPRAGPLVAAHYTTDYFYNNPYKDPLCEVPSNRLYMPPKEPKLSKKDKKLKRKLEGRDTFKPVGPAKWDGGCKAGTFNKWPAWEMCKWLTPLEKQKALAALGGPKVKMPSKGQFYIQSYGHKTTNTTSVLYKTGFSMNNTNWKTYEPTYVKRLLLHVY